jgi:hypothetical protein
LADQGGAELRQQTHLVVHRAGIAQNRTFLARLSTPKHPTNRTIKQTNPVVSQACRGVQHGCDQGCLPTEWRERPEMLSGKTSSLTGQLTQTLGMHAFGDGRVEADRAQTGELLDNALQRLMARGRPEAAH